MCKATSISFNQFERSKSLAIGSNTSDLLQCMGLVSDIYKAVTDVLKGILATEEDAEDMAKPCHEALDTVRDELLNLVKFTIDDATCYNDGVI